MTKSKAAPTSLDAFADQKAAAAHAENEGIARTNRVLRAELATERERTAAAVADRDAAEKTLSLYERKYSARPDWILPPKQAKPAQATVVAVLSDVHAGEVVRQAEIGDYNKFDLAICEGRLERFFRRSIETARSWSAYRYDGAALAVGGDLVSGSIHDELNETNELSVYDTVLWLLPRIAEGIELWRKAFGKVHVVSAPGNHGRDGKIPRYKGRSAHNADTLVMRLVAREFAKVEGVTFDIPESIDASFSIYGYEFSIAHGDELARKFAGTAEIGVLGPLMRGTNRKKVTRQKQGRDLQYALWCHFHQYVPVASRGFIGNGSLKGWDEYAAGLILTPEPPQQALFAVVPGIGVATEDAVRVGDRTAEGW